MLQNLLVDLVKKKFFRLGETNQVEIEYEDSKKFLGKYGGDKEPIKAHLTHDWSEFCAMLMT